MRANKLVVFLGAAKSRIAADAIISKGRITARGQVVLLGERLPQDEQLFLDGAPLARKNKDSSHSYLAFHKPPGYLTSWSQEHGRPCLHDALKLSRQGPPNIPHLMHCGRLDYASEGLLLLTSDGNWSQMVCHPSHGALKRYFVGASRSGAETSQIASPQQVSELLKSGVTLKRDLGSRESTFNERPARAVAARVLSLSEVAMRTTQKNACPRTVYFDIAIKEGRKRVVRRMMKALGWDVTRLLRMGVGKVELAGLNAGEWRHLTTLEINSFLEIGRTGHEE